MILFSCKCNSVDARFSLFVSKKCALRKLLAITFHSLHLWQISCNSILLDCFGNKRQDIFACCNCLLLCATPYARLRRPGLDCQMVHVLSSSVNPLLSSIYLSGFSIKCTLVSLCLCLCPSLWHKF